MRVEKPIITLGVGRSGSTVFHRILAKHPEVSWVSALCDRYPAHPDLNPMLMKAIDVPVVGKKLLSRVHPSEAYVFWESLCKGFSRPCRDLVREDITNRVKSTVLDVMSRQLTPRRWRLMLKITGWPRIGFM